MFIAMTLCSGMKPLATSSLSILKFHLNSCQIPHYLPVSWSSGSVELAPSCTSIVYLWGRCWGKLIQISGSGSKIYLRWSSHQLFCFHAFRTHVPPRNATRASSTVMLSQGAVHALLSTAADNCHGHSPTLMTLGPTLLLPISDEDQEKRRGYL